MFSKLSVVIVCACCLSVSAARTQSSTGRVGPKEDVPAANTGETKAADKSEPKRGAAANRRTAAEPKNGAAKKSGPKTDDRKSGPVPAPSPLTAAASAGDKNASDATTDAPPKANASPASLRESPPVGLIPPPPKYEGPPPPITAENSDGTANTTKTAKAEAAPTALYRVGVGDVLDIRLVNSAVRESTLYTILTGGLLDYPLAGDVLNVGGLTPDEIAARLSAELKRRGVFDRAQFKVSVRDYVSHTVMVSGLVEEPGAKVLRREAVPLYVVLADALPRADAGRAVIISRATGASKAVDLGDPAALNELVSAGDVINVQARPPEFFYIGGPIAAPGQKDFHAGMTLTQALLASGGVVRDAGNKVRVTISRQGADGRLIATDYVLKEIEAGQVPDPRLQAGDRIEVARGKH